MLASAADHIEFDAVHTFHYLAFHHDSHFFGTLCIVWSLGSLVFLIIDIATWICSKFASGHLYVSRSTLHSTLLSSTLSIDPVVHGGLLTSPTATVWRTRRRRIHAVLGRNPRLQRLWIFLVRAQTGKRRPRGPSGCNLSESGPSGKRPSGRAGERLVFFFQETRGRRGREPKKFSCFKGQHWCTRRLREIPSRSSCRTGIGRPIWGAVQHVSLSRDLHFSIVLPPQDVVSGLFEGDRRMVADVVAKQCRIGDQDVCRTSLHFLLGSVSTKRQPAVRRGSSSWLSSSCLVPTSRRTRLVRA